MVKIVCWNIAGWKNFGKYNPTPWDELLRMRDEDGVDVALLQEARPNDLPHSVEADPYEPWLTYNHDRWPMVVRLSDRVKVQWFKQVTPEIHEQVPTPSQRNKGSVSIAQDAIPVSDSRTFATARVTPLPNGKPFWVVSMFARWLGPRPDVKTGWGRGYADASAHRIISDLSAFIGYTNPSTHRILAAGDLKMFYGATDDNKLELPARAGTVFDRMDAIGLKLVGPQGKDADRQANPTPSGLVVGNKNVPTFHGVGEKPPDAKNQFDYVFASKGFDKSVTVYAMNGSANWGPSDHCRIWIEVH